MFHDIFMHVVHLQNLSCEAGQKAPVVLNQCNIAALCAEVLDAPPLLDGQLRVYVDGENFLNDRRVRTPSSLPGVPPTFDSLADALRRDIGAFGPGAPDPDSIIVLVKHTNGRGQPDRLLSDARVRLVDVCAAAGRVCETRNTEIDDVLLLSWALFEYNLYPGRAGIVSRDRFEWARQLIMPVVPVIQFDPEQFYVKDGGGARSGTAAAAAAAALAATVVVMAALGAGVA